MNQLILMPELKGFIMTVEVVGGVAQLTAMRHDLYIISSMTSAGRLRDELAAELWLHTRELIYGFEYLGEEGWNHD